MRIIKLAAMPSGGNPHPLGQPHVEKQESDDAQVAKKCRQGTSIPN